MNTSVRYCLNNLNELLDEIESATQKKGILDTSPFYIVTLAVIILGAGIYVGNLLFGANSLEMLIKLQNREFVLKEKVLQLQNENARLQKEYFELKELEP